MEYPQELFRASAGRRFVAWRITAAMTWSLLFFLTACTNYIEKSKYAELTCSPKTTPCEM